MQSAETKTARKQVPAVSGHSDTRKKRSLTGLWYRIYGWKVPATELPQPLVARVISEADATKALSFTFSLIALSARIACMDGPLTREKYAAFREAFPLTGGICSKLRALFMLACRNTIPLETYVTQVKYAFPRQTSLFSALLERLFCIATADGNLSREEERTLARISHQLEISAQQYAEIHERFSSPQAYRVLGVDRRAKAGRIRQRYYELMRRYHPDHVTSYDTSPEVELLLKLKASEINEAYRALLRKAA